MTVNNGGSGDDAGAAGAGNDDGAAGAGAAGSGDDGGKGGSAAPQPMDLDSVHARVMAEKGEEFSKPEAGDGDDDGAGGDGSGGDDDDDAGGGSGDDDGAGAGAGAGDDGAGSGDDEEGDDKNKGKGAPAGEQDEEGDDGAAAGGEAPTAPEQPVQDDGDISKPGKYKAEFVDEDGKKYYVTDVNQLPEDFEPQSQRQYGVALQDLNDKRGDFRTDMAKYNTEKAKFDSDTAVGKLRTSWNNDIKQLGGDGIKLEDGTVLKLPADKKAREKAIEGTYAYMDAEFKKGNTIEKFATAFEIWSARNARQEAAAAAAAKKKAEDDERKKKGGKVMGSTANNVPTNKGGSAGAGRPLIRDGLPPGVGLDAVHQKAIESMS